MMLLQRRQQHWRLLPTLLLLLLLVTCTAQQKRTSLVRYDENYVPDCRDEDPHCPVWAKAGYCDALPIEIKSACRKSCPHVCDDGTFDWGVPQEASDAETRHVIAETLEYMHTVVYNDDPLFELVHSHCRNLDPQCCHWAAIGECDKEQEWMLENCAPACRACEDLDIRVRCPWDPEQPRAFYKKGDLNAMFENIVEQYPQYHPNILSQPSENEQQDDGPWVVTLDNFLSSQECDELIRVGENMGYERSMAQAFGEDSDDGEYYSQVTTHRTSYQTWCLDECYENPTAQVVMERIANITGIPERHSEYLQLLKYEEGQYYRVHHDFIDLHVMRPMGPRILTIFLYLTNVEEGGGTRFPLLDLTVMPKRGRALIWPSVLDEGDFMEIDQRTDHEALPVERGQKYASNAWLHLGDFKDAFDKDCSS